MNYEGVKMYEYELHVIVLEKLEVYEKLLSALNDAGIANATIFSSTSMEPSLSKHEDSHIIAALRAFMAADRIESKTLFFLAEKDKYKTVHSVLENIVGNLNKRNTAIYFTAPISNIDGIYCDISE
ncbi:hypothetical protein LJB90_00200 [Eubacteriales bacterium OttesenSCG-928-G02]|nr:hypothetical protein [Eubacteriales bacterium OttesenSCG-928-G02]